MRKKGSFTQITYVIAMILAVGCAKADGKSSGVFTWELSFKGAASGGSLVLARTLNRTVKYMSIQTTTGESAESVAQRLADTINALHSRQTHHTEYNPHWLWVGGFQARASGGTVLLPGRAETHILAGTETGLGIPKPPLSLSCSFDEGKDEIVLRWENPVGGYDFILANGYWTNFYHRQTERISGAETSFRIDRKKFQVDVNDMNFRVVGFRGNIPSNAGAIHVSGGGHCQEETYGIPFACGVAPNWSAWSTAARPDTGAFEQAERYPEMQGYGGSARVLLTKPFYQLIKTPPPGGADGIYRKFLGLTPGHTYRITTCLSTIDMDSIKGNWLLSFHAAPGGPNGNNFTTQQLAGLAALPDGKRGPQAGRIAYYHHGKTTKANHEIVFSGDKTASENEDASHIVLPADANTIMVWIRFSCSDPDGKVGFSGVKLEDITANSSVKSPEQIMQEEHQEEVRLLKGVEKAAEERARRENTGG